MLSYQVVQRRYAPSPRVSWKISCRTEIRTQPLPRAFASQAAHLNELAANFFHELNTKGLYRWNTLEDLYDMDSSLIKSHDYGSALLRTYNGSPSQLLKAAFPAHEWQWWRFRHAPAGQWRSPDAQRQYLLWLGKEILGYKADADWYKLTGSDLTANGGRTLLQVFNYSPSLVVQGVFKERTWLEWKFAHPPQGWWDRPANRSRFFDALRDHYGLSSMDSLHTLAIKQIQDFGGGAISHNRTAAEVVTSQYPEHSWEMWRFERVPKGWWQVTSNQSQYIQWLGRKLNYRSMEDWYQISAQIIRDNYGGGLVDTFQGQLQRLIATVLPHHPWQPWQFLRVQTSWWNSPQHQTAFCDWISKELRLKDKSDWYSVTGKQVSALNGRGILAKYRYSMYDLLRSVYPKHEWKAWKFHKTPNHFWDQSAGSCQTLVAKFMTDLATRLDISPANLGKWYRISSANLTSAELAAVSAFGGLKSAIKQAYPSHAWDFSSDGLKRSAQHDLRAAIVSLGTSDNSISEEQAVSGRTLWKNHEMTFDLVLQDQNLVFEYQGEQHYFDVRQLGESRYYASNDETKAVFCGLAGINLVTVPYWYDHRPQTLQSTLQVFSKASR